MISEAKGAGALYGVGFGGANRLKMSLVTAATMLATCLLAFAEANAAGATSLPDNGKIAFTHTFIHEASEIRDIYTANPDGSGLTNLTASTDTSVSESDPAWSPNGSKIAFSSDLNSKSALGSNDIYVMDADGSNLERLTNNDYRFQGVGSWSPNGSKMALSCYRSVWEVCTMDADGSDHTQLTSDGGEGPTWSPDGTKLAFSGIHTMNPDGSNKTLAIAGGDQPDWSPDGTKIAYRRYPPGQSHSDIFIANADGSHPVNLTARISNTSYEAVPAWSPDGAQLAFASNLHEDALHYEIFVIDADGRNLKRLTHTPGTNWDPDWQPLAGPTPSKDADGSDVDQGTNKPGADDVDRNRPEPAVIVKPGDSLWSVSEERLGPEASPKRVYDHTYQMYALNRKLIGSDPDLIFAGQRLSLPPLR